MAGDIYWDSCAIISMLDQTDERYEAILHLWEETAKASAKIITSAISLTEVLNILNLGADKKSEELIIDWFDHPQVRLVAVARHIALEAHKIIKNHGLSALDSIQIASAILSECEVIYTYDGSGKKKQKKILSDSNKIGTPPLRIESPAFPAPGPLFPSKTSPN
ncbi:MAG TPA: type II toxin-antitoxin system VapC family toxin [Gemmatales bacterium]|nr:type II toxin-antitoxin system VapC family toxin [Gemmatales bacterium]